ncbi:ABC transporter permease [Paenibacillus sp. IB182496]|uniref:ABC transporter permease n=1 Tax=Paenibacillus sabuli TaxID=2772509 RepID=A0A927BVG8_9BACL|nr:ABC transporter permease [Paenibacillus sabuli]MBD2846259.1 ABC transporter permease [Paenibacillus sabuli]
MGILRFLFRKMWNTRWMTISTLAGLIVAVAFATSIPMYADGALKRVVASSLEENSDGLPAGSLLMRYQAIGGETTNLDALEKVRNYISEDVPGLIGFSQNGLIETLLLRSTEVTPEDPSKVDASRMRQMSMMAMSGLPDKAELAQGRWFTDTKAKDGMIEAVILEEGMYRNDIHIGDVFEYPIRSGLNLTLRVKIVGAYNPVSPTDPFWYQGLEGLMNGLQISPVAFDGLMHDEQVPIHTANWFYAFDLGEIKTSDLSPLGRTLERLHIDLYQQLPNTRVEISFAPLLADFKQQGLQLQTMLFTLAAPMLAMVFYFIAMNARQALDKQRSDIAVLRSRGAGTRQIIWIYLLEGLLLGAVALALGPLLGWFMAKSIGSANGFLSFVDRKAIPVGFSTEAAIAGGAAVLLAILATVIPAIVYARSSIVGYKQELARGDRSPFWQRWFLDVALLGLAGYGWYLFNERQMLTFQTGMTTDQLNVQPFLFFVPALAIFALGLVFLRVFPWLLKLFNLMGKKLLPVPVYLTLTQLSRSMKAYYPLMILLVLTLGLGVYNASAARTIDLNSTERTLYKYGTDVIISTVWEGQPELPPPSQGGGGSGGGEGGEGGGGNPGNPGNPGGQPQAPVNIIYPEEPPFEVFRTLDGVEAAAKVLQTRANMVVSGSSIGQGMVMGIQNTEFAQVAWMPQDLYPAHPRAYLNALGKYTANAALIPTSVAERYQLKTGDVISAGIGERLLEFVIVGILPYWPSQYPDQAPFLIANLDYIYDEVPMIPYEVWLKMKDGASTAAVMQELTDAGIELASVEDVRIELASQSKHPTRGGVFGILSLGFLVSVIVSLAGYVLYWFFNLSGRVVQFGVLRAMGLSRKQLTGMLLLEQVFTAGLAIVLGIAIGRVTSLLFLPFLQTTGNADSAVPPFRVTFDQQDTVQLYIVVGVMMLIGAVMLLLHIRRLRVHQAVKMGEER